MNYLRKGILYLFPFRDVLGFTVASISIRIGEIFSGFYVIPLIKQLKNQNNLNLLDKNEKFLMLILIANLLITINGVILNFNTIDISFAFKYILRNILNIIFISGFIYSAIIYTKKDIERLIRCTVLLNFSLFVLLYGFDRYFFMGSLLDLSNYRDNGVYFGAFWMPRFIGTCSEPGYLAPILPVFLFYYFKRIFVLNIQNEIKYLFLVLIMIITTFSAAVYVMSILVIIYFFLDNFRCKKVQRLFFALAIVFIVSILFILQNSILSDYIINGIFNKIIAYLTLSTNYMQSSNDRVQQILNCIDFITKGNLVNLFIGNGTGSYSYYVAHEVSLLSTAQEAYNIYLSTIADRGVLGLILIFALFNVLKSFVINGNLYSQTVFLGICLQFLHWLIVGNFWLYYFWYEIVILIGYYKNCKILDNNKF